MIRVGADLCGVERARRDDQAVLGLFGLPARAVDLGDQGRQAVGLVSAQVRDAAQVRSRPEWG